MVADDFEYLIASVLFESGDISRLEFFILMGEDFRCGFTENVTDMNILTFLVFKDALQ